MYLPKANAFVILIEMGANASSYRKEVLACIKIYFMNPEQGCNKVQHVSRLVCISENRSVTEKSALDN